MTGEAKNPGFCDTCIVPELLERMVATNFVDGPLADERVRKTTAELVRLVVENGVCESQAPEPDYAGEGRHTFLCKHENAMLVISHIGDALSTAKSDVSLTCEVFSDDELTPGLKQLIED